MGGGKDDRADRQGGWTDDIRFLEVFGDLRSVHLETLFPQAMRSRAWTLDGRGEDSVGEEGETPIEIWEQRELKAIDLFVCLFVE